MKEETEKDEQKTKKIDKAKDERKEEEDEEKKMDKAKEEIQFATLLQVATVSLIAAKCHARIRKRQG